MITFIYTEVGESSKGMRKSLDSYFTAGGSSKLPQSPVNTTGKRSHSNERRSLLNELQQPSKRKKVEDTINLIDDVVVKATQPSWSERKPTTPSSATQVKNPLCQIDIIGSKHSGGHSLKHH